MKENPEYMAQKALDAAFSRAPSKPTSKPKRPYLDQARLPVQPSDNHSSINRDFRQLDDPVAALASSPHGRHYAQLLLTETPEDTLGPDDATRVARILYAGSYIALWQYIRQFHPGLPLRDQDRIVARALAYIKHVESLKLAPLQLDPRNNPADQHLLEQAAKLRARLVEVTQTIRAISPPPPSGEWLSPDADDPVTPSELPPSLRESLNSGQPPALHAEGVSSSMDSSSSSNENSPKETEP